MVRRQSLRRKSTLTSLLFGEDEAEALKSKNIKQTELVAALREAITRTAEHFHCLDPHHSSTVSAATAKKKNSKCVECVEATPIMSGVFSPCFICRT